MVAGIPRRSSSAAEPREISPPLGANVPAELMQLDNAVLLPHVGSATHETRAAMAQRVFDNLSEFFARGRLVSAIAA